MNAQFLEEPVVNWKAGMQRFLKAESDYQDAARGTDEEAEDGACDAYSDARWNLIHMPAPDLGALRWKLEYLLEGSNGSIDPWELTALEQTMRDIRRLMHPTSDAVIKSAWARRLTALRIFNSLTKQERDQSTGDRTPAAQACWDEIDAADEEIRTAVATTVEGARIQLHCALLAMVGTEAQEAALLERDLEEFAQTEDRLDYPQRLAFSALRSLSAMEMAA